MTEIDILYPCQKELQKEKQKKYRERKRDERIKNSKDYYEANKKEILAKRKRSKRKNKEAVLWRSARERSIKHGLSFTIKVEDIVIPATCPILKIPLFVQGGKVGPNSPSLDRIIPDSGYIPENIQVISYLANTMKSNATPEQLLNFAKWVLNEYS